MTDNLIATSKLIDIRKSLRPPEEHADETKSEDQQRAEFLRGLELLILTRDHERNISLSGG